MSRSGYDGNCENSIGYCWNAMVERALAGKRGQKFLREMEAALLALPKKELCAYNFAKEGRVCALGAVAVRREIEDGWAFDTAMKILEAKSEQLGDENDEWSDIASEKFDIARAMAQEIQEQNDSGRGSWCGPNGQNYVDHSKGEEMFDLPPELPEERWDRMLRWVRSKIKPQGVKS